MKKRLLLLSIIIILCTTPLAVRTASATIMDVTIHAGQEVTNTINLQADDHVVIKYSVLGEQDDTTINFYMTNPDQAVGITNPNSAGGTVTFVCTNPGDYVLHFSNGGSTIDKFVSIDYEIEHYILGMPQMFFLTIVIALLCVAAVAVFIFNSKTH
jgi:hypothetical protein